MQICPMRYTRIQSERHQQEMPPVDLKRTNLLTHFLQNETAHGIIKKNIFKQEKLLNIYSFSKSVKIYLVPGVNYYFVEQNVIECIIQAERTGYLRTYCVKRDIVIECIIQAARTGYLRTYCVKRDIVIECIIQAARTGYLRTYCVKRDMVYFLRSSINFSSKALVRSE